MGRSRHSSAQNPPQRVSAFSFLDGMASCSNIGTTCRVLKSWRPSSNSRSVFCIAETADDIMAGSSAVRRSKTIPGFFSAAVSVSRLLENSQEGIHHHLAASRQVAQTARRKLPISISSNQWRWRWNAFETPGLEPVFPKTDEAIAYLRFL